MSLESGKLICLDEIGNQCKEIVAKGRKFTFGYFMNCDCVLTDKRAKGIHCEINCDAFGRVTIRNLSTAHPILVNKNIVQIKCALLNNSKLCILDKQYIWQYSKVMSTESACLKLKLCTPERVISAIEPHPNSCPNFKAYRETLKRFTVHNFLYSIESNAIENNDIRSQDVNCNDVHIVNTSNSDCAVSTPIHSEIKNKINDSSQKKGLLLSLCNQSDVLITSYSPREVGIRIEKSFTAVVPPRTLGKKSSWKNIHGTTRDIFRPNDYSHMIDFSTPSTSKKLGLHTLSEQKKNSSMHLIDLTTPTKKIVSNISFKKRLLNNTELLNNNLSDTPVINENCGKQTSSSFESVISVSSNESFIISENIFNESITFDSLEKTPKCNLKTMNDDNLSLLRKSILNNSKNRIISSPQLSILNVTQPAWITRRPLNRNIFKTLTPKCESSNRMTRKNLLNVSTPRNRTGSRQIGNRWCDGQMMTIDKLCHSPHISKSVTKHSAKNRFKSENIRKISFKSKSPQEILSTRLVTKAKKIINSTRISNTNYKNSNKIDVDDKDKLSRTFTITSSEGINSDVLRGSINDALSISGNWQKDYNKKLNELDLNLSEYNSTKIINEENTACKTNEAFKDKSIENNVAPCSKKAEILPISNKNENIAFDLEKGENCNGLHSIDKDLCKTQMLNEKVIDIIEEIHNNKHDIDRNYINEVLSNCKLSDAIKIDINIYETNTNNSTFINMEETDKRNLDNKITNRHSTKTIKYQACGNQTNIRNNFGEQNSLSDSQNDENICLNENNGDMDCDQKIIKSNSIYLQRKGSVQNKEIKDTIKKTFEKLNEPLNSSVTIRKQNVDLNREIPTSIENINNDDCLKLTNLEIHENSIERNNCLKSKNIKGSPVIEECRDTLRNHMKKSFTTQNANLLGVMSDGVNSESILKNKMKNLFDWHSDSEWQSENKHYKNNINKISVKQLSIEDNIFTVKRSVSQIILENGIRHRRSLSAVYEKKSPIEKVTRRISECHMDEKKIKRHLFIEKLHENIANISCACHSRTLQCKSILVKDETTEQLQHDKQKRKDNIKDSSFLNSLNTSYKLSSLEKSDDKIGKNLCSLTKNVNKDEDENLSHIPPLLLPQISSKLKEQYIQHESLSIKSIEKEGSLSYISFKESLGKNSRLLKSPHKLTEYRKENESPKIVNKENDTTICGSYEQLIKDGSTLSQHKCDELSIKNVIKEKDNSYINTNSDGGNYDILNNMGCKLEEELQKKQNINIDEEIDSSTYNISENSPILLNLLRSSHKLKNNVQNKIRPTENFKKEDISLENLFFVSPDRSQKENSNLKQQRNIIETEDNNLENFESKQNVSQSKNSKFTGILLDNEIIMQCHQIKSLQNDIKENENLLEDSINFTELRHKNKQPIVTDIIEKEVVMIDEIDALPEYVSSDISSKILNSPSKFLHQNLQNDILLTEKRIEKKDDLHMDVNSHELRREDINLPNGSCKVMKQHQQIESPQDKNRGDDYSSNLLENSNNSESHILSINLPSKHYSILNKAQQTENQIEKRHEFVSDIFSISLEQSSEENSTILKKDNFTSIYNTLEQSEKKLLKTSSNSIYSQNKDSSIASVTEEVSELVDLSPTSLKCSEVKLDFLTSPSKSIEEQQGEKKNFNEEERNISSEYTFSKGCKVIEQPQQNDPQSIEYEFEKKYDLCNDFLSQKKNNAENDSSSNFAFDFTKQTIEENLLKSPTNFMVSHKRSEDLPTISIEKEDSEFIKPSSMFIEEKNSKLLMSSLEQQQEIQKGVNHKDILNGNEYLNMSNSSRLFRSPFKLLGKHEQPDTLSVENEIKKKQNLSTDVISATLNKLHEKNSNLLEKSICEIMTQCKSLQKKKIVDNEENLMENSMNLLVEQHDINEKPPIVNIFEKDIFASVNLHSASFELGLEKKSQQQQQHKERKNIDEERDFTIVYLSSENSSRLLRSPYKLLEQRHQNSHLKTDNLIDDIEYTNTYQCTKQTTNSLESPHSKLTDKHENKNELIDNMKNGNNFSNRVFLSKEQESVESLLTSACKHVSEYQQKRHDINENCEELPESLTLNTEKNVEPIQRKVNEEGSTYVLDMEYSMPQNSKKLTNISPIKNVHTSDENSVNDTTQLALYEKIHKLPEKFIEIQKKCTLNSAETKSIVENDDSLKVKVKPDLMPSNQSSEETLKLYNTNLQDTMLSSYIIGRDVEIKNNNESFNELMKNTNIKNLQHLQIENDAKNEKIVSEDIINNCSDNTLLSVKIELDNIKKTANNHSTKFLCDTKAQKSSSNTDIDYKIDKNVNVVKNNVENINEEKITSTIKRKKIDKLQSNDDGSYTCNNLENENGSENCYEVKSSLKIEDIECKMSNIENTCTKDLKRNNSVDTDMRNFPNTKSIDMTPSADDVRILHSGLKKEGVRSAQRLLPSRQAKKTANNLIVSIVQDEKKLSPLKRTQSRSNTISENDKKTSFLMKLDSIVISNNVSNDNNSIDLITDEFGKETKSTTKGRKRKPSAKLNNQIHNMEETLQLDVCNDTAISLHPTPQRRSKRKIATSELLLNEKIISVENDINKSPTLKTTKRIKTRGMNTIVNSDNQFDNNLNDIESNDMHSIISEDSKLKTSPKTVPNASRPRRGRPRIKQELSELQDLLPKKKLNMEKLLENEPQDQGKTRIKRIAAKRHAVSNVEVEEEAKKNLLTKSNKRTKIKQTEENSIVVENSDPENIIDNMNKTSRKRILRNKEQLKNVAKTIDDNIDLNDIKTNEIDQLDDKIEDNFIEISSTTIKQTNNIPLRRGRKPKIIETTNEAKVTPKTKKNTRTTKALKVRFESTEQETIKVEMTNIKEQSTTLSHVISSPKKRITRQSAK